MSKPRPAYGLSLPPDVNLAIMIVLSFHLGRGNLIPSTDLCAALRELGINERQLHAQIDYLRHSGHLVGSVSGEGSGYFLIINQEELEDFLQREYLAKIDDMQQTMEAMIEAASQRWGYDSIQRKSF